MQFDKFKAEACIRVCLAVLAAVIFSIADLPKAIPPNYKYLIGIMGTSFLLSFPIMPFAIGSIVPSGLLVVLIASGFSTMILCGVTVSRGLFLALYSIVTFWATSLFFGANFDKTYAAATGLIVAFSMLSLNLQSLVEDGISENVPLNDTSVQPYCWAVSSTGNCTAADFELSQPIPYDVPSNSSSIFAGQAVFITAGNSDLVVHAPGGLWVVSLLWTEKGLTNPFAVYRNLMIISCWLFIPTAIAALLPPWRTLRNMLSQQVVPQVLQVLQGALSSQMEEKQPSKQESAKQQRKGVHLWFSMNTASQKAGTIIFEPRLCKAPFEYIVPQLSALLSSVTNLVLVITLPSSIFLPAQEDGEIARQEALIEQSTTLLGDSSKMLQDDCSEDYRPQKEDMFGNFSRADYINKYCTKVANSSYAWLQALNPQTEDPQTLSSWNRFKKTYLVWVLAPLLIPLALVKSVALPFRPKTWNARSALWSLKLTAGYVALFAMTVYWKAWNSFAINVDNFPTGHWYHGWHLAAYSATYRPTFEGTIKKGIQRLVGTCLGGFLAWLGIIVCSWSYDDAAPVNPYGLTAWLTVTTALPAMISLNPGLSSMLGFSVDHGYIGMYTGLVEVLIALEVYLGFGTKGDITANRIVANVTGIVMSMIISALPPISSGSDPVHAKEFCSALSGVVEELLEMMKNARGTGKPVDLGNLKKQKLVDASVKRRKALLGHKDANRLAKLPLMKVDSSLTNTLEELVLTEWMIKSSLEYIDSLQSASGSEEWSAVCTAISQNADLDDREGEVDATANIALASVVKWFQTIQLRLVEEQATLEQLKWKFLKGWTATKEQESEEPAANDYHA